jgi:hypothetical protein
LKLEYDELLSNVALNFNFCRYIKAYFTARLMDKGEVLLIDTHAPVEPPPPW